MEKFKNKIQEKNEVAQNLNNKSSNNLDSKLSLKQLMKKQIKINKLEKGKKIEIKNKSFEDDEFYTIYMYELISGKKHQIRKHMSRCFFTPIFNDEDYFFDKNYSYMGYKNFVSELNKYQENLDHNKENPNEENKNGKIKKLFLNNKLDKDDYYKRYNIDDFSSGIFLNSYQFKMDNNLENLKEEIQRLHEEMAKEKNLRQMKIKDLNNTIKKNE